MRILSNGRLLVGFASNSSLNDVKVQFSTGSGSSTDVSVGIFNNGTPKKKLFVIDCILLYKINPALP